MKHQWRVEFRKTKENRLPSGVHRVTETSEVVVYAKDSPEAIGVAMRVGGVATQANVCCVTRTS